MPVLLTAYCKSNSNASYWWTVVSIQQLNLEILISGLANKFDFQKTIFKFSTQSSVWKQKLLRMEKIRSVDEIIWGKYLQDVVKRWWRGVVMSANLLYFIWLSLSFRSCLHVWLSQMVVGTHFFHISSYNLFHLILIVKTLLVFHSSIHNSSLFYLICFVSSKAY